MLNHKTRYLQIAFNDDVYSSLKLISLLPQSERLIIEAGTPFIKREGSDGIRAIANYWSGEIVADLKTTDGALEEVELAYLSGATAATVLGSAPRETINLFIQKCDELKMDSMIDMLGVEDPLDILWHLKKPPNVVVLHRGRDEETTRGKVIKYKHINRILGKYDVLISAAGGVDLKEARSAIFNGANIVVVNVVNPDDPWTGISTDQDIADMANKFLKTIE